MAGLLPMGKGQTQEGHENTLESTMNGYDVHFENGLNLMGLGTKDIEMYVPREAYYSLLDEYYYKTPIKPTYNINLFRYASPSYEVNDIYDIHNSWAEKYQNNNSYIYSMLDTTFATDRQTAIFEFKPSKITTPSVKTSFDWTRNMRKSGYAGNANQNEDTMGFRFKGGTTYTFQFKMRLPYDYRWGFADLDNSLATMFGSSSNKNIDTTKPFIVNGKNYADYPHRKGVATPSVEGAVEWHKVLKDDGININERHLEWITCSVQFTTLPEATLKEANYHFYRFRTWAGGNRKPIGEGRGRFQITQPMLWEGENDKYTDFALDDNAIGDYKIHQGKEGLRYLYPSVGFYYSRDLDYCCAYKINTLKGVEVLDWSPNTEEFKIKCEIDVFAQIPSPEVTYVKGQLTADELAKDKRTIYNTITHGNRPNAWNDSTDQRYYLLTQAKGCIMNVFHNVSTYVPYEMNMSINAWDKSTYNIHKGQSNYWCYTGEIEFNNKEN